MPAYFIPFLNEHPVHVSSLYVWVMLPMSVTAAITFYFNYTTFIAGDDIVHLEMLSCFT